MSDRMRSVQQSATLALANLIVRYGPVTFEQPQPGVYSVRVGDRYFDAGTVEDAVNAAHLAKSQSEVVA